MVADGGDDNRLRDLSVSDNEFAGLVVANAGNSEITGTSASSNGLETEGTGFVLLGSHHSRLTRNRTSGNGDAGVFVGNSHNIVIAENVATDTVHCADGGCGQGISLEGGTGNLIERNLVERTVEAGIRVAAFEPDTPPATGNTVRRNVIRDSATDGVLVEETAKDTLVERNLAIGSGDDGIDVDNAATTLIRNAANHNGDLGIEAVAGVLDGGHNRASGNGDPAQCRGVICRSDR